MSRSEGALEILREQLSECVGGHRNHAHHGHQASSLLGAASVAQTAGRRPGQSRVCLTQVEGAALTNIIVVAIQPLVSTLPAKITQLLEEAPGCVEARSSRECVEPCAAVDAV